MFENYFAPPKYDVLKKLKFLLQKNDIKNLEIFFKTTKATMDSLQRLEREYDREKKQKSFWTYQKCISKASTERHILVLI